MKADKGMLLCIAAWVDHCSPVVVIDDVDSLIVLLLGGQDGNISSLLRQCSDGDGQRKGKNR